MKNCAHIIVDFQNSFVDENGSLSVHASHLGKIIKKVSQEFKKRAFLVIATADWHPEGHISFAKTHGKLPTYTDQSWPVHCVENTRGAKIHPSIKGVYDYLHKKGTNKNYEEYSAFDRQGILSKKLKEHNITDLYISGVATDYCVGATIKDGIKNGYNVYVLTDLIKGVNKENSKKTIELLKKEPNVKLIQSSQIEFR